ncbi:MAG: GNAT family N-acetyltransferase [Bacillota bacterium]|nr:GNAT family N-acetyltransferase [Bacillota bacterium]
MKINMQKYEKGKHDARLVATLIYSADQEFNTIVYGEKENGINAIEKMMQMEYNYFTYPHVNCAVTDEGEVVGVLVGFEGKEKKALDQVSGKCFAQAFGFLTFLIRIPSYMRLSGISWKEIDDDGYMVNSLCVAPDYRGKGIGSKMMEWVFSKHKKVYLDVNIYNEKAQSFYERLGFEPESRNTMNYKGKTVGLISLKKE